MEGQKITIESTNATGLKQLRLYLHDELLDLDSAVSVVWDGAIVFEGKVPRTQESITKSLEERMDLSLAASAILQIQKP